MSSRRKLANAIRFLSVDMVQRAKSGHPGAPMGMADFVEVLWNDFLKHNPSDPTWPDRDRFVLSNGHASTMLYSLLHLSGYDLSLQDLQAFRQLGSRTPGHPERLLGPNGAFLTSGVETTTGPLGQGLANAVGMALAEKLLAARYNRLWHKIVDHYTYVICGDGCLMEGISHEACSIAGTLGLGKLIALYDDNGISIDGPVRNWFRDDTPKRFQAYNWQVIANVDGHNPTAVAAALKLARAEMARPSLICLKTQIGFGAPGVCNKASCHGSPLEDTEITAARKALCWDYAPFEIPDIVYAAFNARSRGAEAQAAWTRRLEAYRRDYSTLAAEFERCLTGDLPTAFMEKAEELLRVAQKKDEAIATRKASQAILEVFGPLLSELVGGSADLSESNSTYWEGATAITPENWKGNYINYGVREFGMAGIMNGLALHGAIIPYGGTFLIFSDYARNGIRMAALMGLKVIWVLTHDSVGVGEDGPTHQPVEQIASLRLIPNLEVWRPADVVETVAAWQSGLKRNEGPTVLCLTRQNLPRLTRDIVTLKNVGRGGYVLVDCQSTPEVIVLATGSEVFLALMAQKRLAAAGRQVRVVSMPCMERFAAQDTAYHDTVLPKTVTSRVAVEAGATAGWYQYVGLTGQVLGLDRFGESGPGYKLFEHFGFTVDNLIKIIESVL
ncbi:transketolase 1 [Desulfovibrionales bacterium]